LLVGQRNRVELILAIRLQLTCAQTVPQPRRVDSWYPPISSEFEFLDIRILGIADNDRGFGRQLFVIRRACQVSVKPAQVGGVVTVPIEITTFVT
jgi:hypothetical protein